MWGRGYFACTTGNVSDEMLKEYIDGHLEKEDAFHVGEWQAPSSRTHAALGRTACSRLQPEGHLRCRNQAAGLQPEVSLTRASRLSNNSCAVERRPSFVETEVPP